jgi:hypothetical protein
MIVLLGLDGEMSCSELAQGAVLVQIGVALSATERFSSLLGYEEGSYFSTEKGMAAHGIDPAPPPEVVDVQLRAWLEDALTRRGLGLDAKRLVPVGFNVGGFDLPFVARYLPRSYELLSRRVVDLNAFLMAYDAAGRTYQGSSPKWSGWKRLAVAYAAEQIAAQGIEVSHHDAGYDALEALYVLEFLEAAARSAS